MIKRTQAHTATEWACVVLALYSFILHVNQRKSEKTFVVGSVRML
jgi:hypothetical protein